MSLLFWASFEIAFESVEGMEYGDRMIRQCDRVYPEYVILGSL